VSEPVDELQPKPQGSSAGEEANVKHLTAEESLLSEPAQIATVPPSIHAEEPLPSLEEAAVPSESQPTSLASVQTVASHYSSGGLDDSMSTQATDLNFLSSLRLESYSDIEARVMERARKEKREEDELAGKREAERQADRDRHSSVLEASRETIRKNQEVLDKTRETMAGLEKTMAGLKETEEKFKRFDAAWKQVFDTAAEKIGASIENIEELKAAHGEPRTCDLDEAAVQIAECNKVLILIGAGLSAESGIPTFKDNEETWEVDGQNMTHVEMCRLEVLQSYPLEFWQKHQMMHIRMRNSSPNEGHYAVAELADFLRRVGKGVAVVTQNIDSLDRLVLGPEADLYEVHGSLSYMRCMFSCSDELFPAPDEEYLSMIPCCYNCGGPARPNILMFDENYTEQFYRADTAYAAAMDSDCLIVIGTALGVSWPAKLVKEFAKTGKLIVEVNIEPSVEYGRVLVFPDRCGAVLPSLVDRVISILRS
jgi:NAD-dependent deacetylase